MAEAYGTGHYVGNFLFLEQDYDDDFMLEGDDIVVVDGADTINGTGLEDAYNGGYYYNWVAHPMPEPEGASPPFAIRPLNGILRREKTSSPPFARADQYRWMIADRVSFTQISRGVHREQLRAGGVALEVGRVLVSAADPPCPARRRRPRPAIARAASSCGRSRRIPPPTRS